jgi:23S rRNA pseudouridine2457 synthase
MNRDCTYILLNKPFGLLSQFSDADGHFGLNQLNLPPEVYPAGRLDRDSEGLLLLTNDGPFIKTYLDPHNGHARVYWAQVEGIPTEDKIKELQRPIRLKEFTTLPSKAKILSVMPKVIWDRDPPIRYRATIATTWIELTLTEGKNRQVRRMSASIGHPTLRLIRTQILNLNLKGIEKPGQWRILERKEIIL